MEYLASYDANFLQWFLRCHICRIEEDSEQQNIDSVAAAIIISKMRLVCRKWNKMVQLIWRELYKRSEKRGLVRIFLLPDYVSAILKGKIQGFPFVHHPYRFLSNVTNASQRGIESSFFCRKYAFVLIRGQWREKYMFWYQLKEGKYLFGEIRLTAEQISTANFWKVKDSGGKSFERLFLSHDIQILLQKTAECQKRLYITEYTIDDAVHTVKWTKKGIYYSIFKDGIACYIIDASGINKKYP